MWLSRATYERLVSEAALALQVPKLELRAEQAEATLAKERELHRQESRHWASMFLRREKTFPLPPTPDERAEKQAEQQARQTQPPSLTDDQQARLQAVRAWAKSQGLSQEDADRAFMAQLHAQVDE